MAGDAAAAILGEAPQRPAAGDLESVTLRELGRNGSIEAGRNGSIEAGDRARLALALAIDPASLAWPGWRAIDRSRVARPRARRPSARRPSDRSETEGHERGELHEAEGLLFSVFE